DPWRPWGAGPGRGGGATPAGAAASPPIAELAPGEDVWHERPRARRADALQARELLHLPHGRRLRRLQAVLTLRLQRADLGIDQLPPLPFPLDLGPQLRRQRLAIPQGARGEVRQG